ncbi:MAG TPA: nitroreductase family protein [Planctomycetota bacterium]
MDFLDLARRRISVRHFTAEPVPRATIERILEAARWAPSGANRQPWRFVVVGDAGAKAEIRRHCESADARWHANAPAWMKQFFDAYEIMPVKEYLTTVPWLVCVFGRRGSPYWKESAWIAIAHVLLATVAEGLHSLPYTPGQTRYLNRIFHVDDEFVPLAVLPIGHPDPARAPKRADHPRKALAELADFDPPFSVYDPTAADDAPAPYGVTE